MSDNSTQERRRHPRVIAHLPVRTRSVEPGEMGGLLDSIGETDPNLPAMGMKKSRAGAWTMATTNLSVGGISTTGDLQVIGDKPLEKGHDLMVEMDLQDGFEPLRAVAQIMWVAKNSQDRWLAGLMFVIISEPNLDRIRKYVSAALERGEEIP